MVASKGGISEESAWQYTRRRARDMSYALAMAHGGEVNWENGSIEPPKASRAHIDSAVREETMRFGR